MNMMPNPLWQNDKNKWLQSSKREISNPGEEALRGQALLNLIKFKVMPLEQEILSPNIHIDGPLQLAVAEQQRDLWVMGKYQDAIYPLDISQLRSLVPPER